MNFKTFLKRVVNGRYNQANFQLVVLCHLTKQGQSTKEEIIKSLEVKNQDLVKQNYDFRSCPVWRVLTQHKRMITQSKKGYLLNVEPMTPSQKTQVLTFCKSILN